MQISSLHIKNFKYIRDMEIRDIENALILVGKNNTGKTSVLDAVRAVNGSYQVRESDFNEKKAADRDLHDLVHLQGRPADAAPPWACECLPKIYRLV